MSEPTVQAIENLLRSPQGLLLFTGPAGSGKTTSIYTVLSRLVALTEKRCSIIAIEDPVESIIAGVTQTQVNPGAGFDFARILPAVLRQDPEVIMIGEIRDPQTARIAVQAGLTGHLVISTVHSGRAAGVFIRLLEMGVAPFLLRSAMRVIVAQRLLRRLCCHCKYPRRAGESPLETIADYLPGKCGNCKNTGYSGRQAIAECLLVGPDLCQALSDDCDEAGLENLACELGMVTLAHSAMQLLSDGVTSLAEAQRALSDYFFFRDKIS